MVRRRFLGRLERYLGECSGMSPEALGGQPAMTEALAAEGFDFRLQLRLHRVGRSHPEVRYGRGPPVDTHPRSSAMTSP